MSTDELTDDPRTILAASSLLKFSLTLFGVCVGVAGCSYLLAARYLGGILNRR